MKSSIKALAYILLLVLISAIVFAVPARPGVHTFEQPDGTTFKGYLKGDENNHWYETIDGYLIEQVGDWWIYNVPSDSGDGSQRLASSFNSASDAATYVEENRELVVGYTSPKKAGAIESSAIMEVPSASVLKSSSPKERSSSAKSQTKQYISSPTGEQKVVVILVNFTDKTQNASNTPAYFWNMLFNTSNPYSMASYYNEVSYGQISFTGVIAGNKWYQSANSLAYYGGDCSDVGSDDCFGPIYELTREAVQLADADINFANYDSDSDDVVDHVIVIHAGYGQEYSYVANDIWSHRWYIDYPYGEEVDGKYVLGYTMNPEYGKVGVFAHEMGHDIGLPDLYDTDTGAYVVGKWDLMDYGSWAGPGDDGSVPTHLSSWSKILLGWLIPTSITSESPRTYYVDYLAANAEAYIVNTSLIAAQDEYFIVENRKKASFDAYIPEEGIVIWHIDNYFAGEDGLSFNDINAYSIKGVIPENTSTINDAAFSSNDGKQYFNSTSIPNSSTNFAFFTNISIYVNSSEAASMKVDFFGGDDDSDGVPNAQDLCPTVAGSALYNGCIPTQINSITVTPDNFICALNGDSSDLNRNLALVVNITNSTPITVSTNLSSVGLNSIYNLTYLNNKWNLTAAVLNTALYQFAQANIVLNVRDTLGTPVVGQNFTAVLLYNMTTPPTINNCERQGGAATVFCNITNFSNVNFIIEIEKNGSSTCNGQELPWNNTFQKVITINFTSIDMSSPTIGQRLQNLGSAIRPNITSPGQFGDSYIYVNSSAIQELNSSARITFYGLPFSQQPNVIGDGITVNSFALNTPYYIPSPIEMWIPNSNFTFTVGHFSQYNITDNIKPKINITAPTSGQQFSTSTVRLNVTVNGTGTQLYNITYKIDGVQVFSVSNANIFSQCHALSPSWDAVYCNYTATSLSAGTHNLTVIATDLGGSAGNTNTSSITFTTAGLYLTVHSPVEGNYYNSHSILVNLTSNGETFWLNHTNGSSIIPYTVPAYLSFKETTNPSSPSFLIIKTNNSESEEASSAVSFFVDTTAPRAVFTASTQTIYVGQNVSFYSAASDALVWINQSWNFGDGKTNFSNASTVSKTYNLAGTYTVNLTVKDRAGNTNSSIMAITVSNSYMTSTGTVPIVYPDASSTIINLNSTEVGYAVPNITATGNLTVPIIAIYGNVSPDTAINATSALSKIIKYLEINLSNTSWNDAGNSANVTFYIPNATLNELGLSPTDVTTFRYSAGTWTELATRVVDSTVDPLIFSFTTNHFTLFSIGKKTSSTPPSGGGGGGGTVFKAVSLNFTDGVSYIYDSKQGKQYSFTVGNIQKNLKIQTVASELVSFMLSSPMNFFQLGAGESMDFDFDADGDTDAIITLSAIDGKTIDFIVELPSLVPTQTIKEEKPSAKAITADVVKETVVENKQAAAAIAENSEVIVNSSTQPNSKNSIMISPAVKIGGIIILVIVIAVLIITVFKAIKEMPKQPPKQNIIQTQTTNTQATNKSNQNSEIDEYKKKLEEINKQL
jgi:M6 family metalloprotease-like protein/PGF-pre-PGF domain-containing protein